MENSDGQFHLSNEEWEKLESNLLSAVDNGLSSIDELETMLNENHDLNEKLVYAIRRSKVEVCASEVDMPETRNVIMHLFEHCTDIRRILFTLFCRLKEIKHSMAKEVVAHHHKVVMCMSEKELIKVREFSGCMPLSLWYKELLFLFLRRIPCWIFWL